MELNRGSWTFVSSNVQNNAYREVPGKWLII